MPMKWIKALFVVAGVYDGGLALAFLFFSPSIFAAFGVPEANHIGYIQFPALLLLLFAIMFFQIARSPNQYRSFIPYGVGLKAAYCGTAFWNDFLTGVPGMWMIFAWADLAFLILFLVAFRATGAPERSSTT